MDESEFHPTTYQLYRTYLQREVEENYQPLCATQFEYWSAQVMERYPDSEWAILIENPTSRTKKIMPRKSVGIRGAAATVLCAYQEVLLAADEIINYHPTNNYVCKYLTAAQSIGGLSARPAGIAGRILSRFS